MPSVAQHAGVRINIPFKDLTDKEKDFVLNGPEKKYKMNSTYKQMTKARNAYPKNQVQVLNIIGNIGNNSDGRVENISSLSLKYLVSNRAKSYRIVKIKGKNAQHSKLHNNPQVDRVLIKFLWNK